MPDINTEAMPGHTAKVCLQILPSLGTGGVERGTVEIAEALVAAGWHALVASAGGPRVKDLERVGATHIELPLKTKSPFAIRRNAERLAEIITTHDVDIVHARSRAPAWSAHAAARRTGRPFVTTFHGVYGTGPLGLKKPYNAIMTKGDRVIAISEFIRDHMRKIYGTPDERITVIHRGVDLTAFDPDQVSPARMVQLSQQWRLPDDGAVVMLPGRLSRWKGHDLLLDALAEMKHQGQLPASLRCLLVGPTDGRGAMQAHLNRRIAALGLNTNVQIIDDCRDMAAAYMVTDVVVSASTRPEAFGRTVAEAQAMGRPVVAPAHGAAEEILIHGVTGRLFTPGDPRSLAAALTKTLEFTSQERHDLALTARQRMADMFDRRFMCTSTLALYEEVLARRDAGSQAAE